MTTTCVVCGKKSQDYPIECYCCGNTYCSENCKNEYHQKKLFHHHSWSDYKDIYEEVMNIDPNIRLVTICDMAGRIKYSDHRKNVVNLLSLEESKKSLKLAVDAWKIRRELAPKIGKGKYVLAEYERIKRITLPLGEGHLIYITTAPEANHSDIINRIKEICEKKQIY